MISEWEYVIGCTGFLMFESGSILHYRYIHHTVLLNYKRDMYFHLN
jgi:hypothetical protein